MYSFHLRPKKNLAVKLRHGVCSGLGMAMKAKCNASLVCVHVHNHPRTGAAQGMLMTLTASRHTVLMSLHLSNICFLLCSQWAHLRHSVPSSPPTPPGQGITLCPPRQLILYLMGTVTSRSTDSRTSYLPKSFAQATDNLARQNGCVKWQFSSPQSPPYVAYGDV